MKRVLRRASLVCGLVLALNPFHLRAQNTARKGDDSSPLLSAFEWRDVGRMRGGRVFGVAGYASQPDTFYFGSVGGGVWQAENAGRTWPPISDRGIPIDSNRAIAVAPSDANIVYVSTVSKIPDRLDALRSIRIASLEVFRGTNS